MFYPKIVNIITYCDYHKREIENLGGRCVRMRLPFNISEFRLKVSKNQARKLLNIPENYYTILFLGRPTYLKGLHVLYDAFTYLTKVKKVQLVIVGDFCKDRKGRLFYEPCIKARTAEKVKWRHINKKIITRGDQERKLIPFYFAASDVLVCPSLYEAGVSYVNLEAMASERPIIASDIPGLSLVLKNGQNALLFKPGDSRDLYEKLLALMKNKNLVKRIVKNNKVLVKQYDHRKVIIKLDKYYDKVYERYTLAKPKNRKF